MFKKTGTIFRIENSNKWALCYTKSLTLDDVEVKNKVVLVRVDFNSPIDPETKKIIDDSRIRAHGESTIKELSEKGAKVVVLAHQGRKG